MLLREPQPRVKSYTFSLTDEEREEVRKRKKNLSPLRKKFEDINRRAEIRKMRQRMGYPYDRESDRPRRKKFL